MAEELGTEGRAAAQIKREASMAEKVVIYTRVSTEEQAKGGTSLAAQKAACPGICRAAGLHCCKGLRRRGGIRQNHQPHRIEGTARVLPHFKKISRQ